MSQDKEPTVQVTYTYYRDETGEARIRVTCGTTILSDEPNPYSFVDTAQMKPWVEFFGNEKRMVKQ